MLLRLLLVFLGIALAINLAAAPESGVAKTGIISPAAPVALAATAPILAKPSDVVLSDGSGMGRTMCDSALRISLVMLALFGLWGLKRMMA